MRTLFISTFCFFFYNYLSSQTLTDYNSLSIQTLTEKAENYDPDAQYVLGLAYLKGEIVEKDTISAANYLLHSAGGGRCEIGFQNIYGYKMSDPSLAKRVAKEKLVELSKNEASKYQSLLLAYVGWWYDANENLTMAEYYYKKSIAKAEETGLGNYCLGMMYFTAKYTILSKSFENNENLEEKYWIEDAPLYHSDIVENFLNDYKKADSLKDKYWLEKAIIYHLEKAVERGFGDIVYGIFSTNDYLNYTKEKLLNKESK